ncbi:CvpA family protein [Siphonobacter aquaeclarae]|jgi:membrane protein required for colicin V production|uniref:Membrane protein required for colicin V production n=1 Tax=Siphonobacter aquaeclarae TaxID=563176 RepID=A0A1G9YJ15_9BACT|nr:CvpA family protein [Siphonobacter aquaeclarae]SDN08902.1 membrane protein required for colicin V production [Siphonobacter aquaeclarae]
MNFLDLFLLLPLAYGAYTGFQRGVLVEIIAVVAFVVSIILGFKLLNEAIAFISPYVSETIARKFLPYIGFSGVFVLVIFTINRFGWLLRKSIRYTLMGSFDSMAGAVVGLFTYAFGVSLFLWLLSALHVGYPDKRQAAASMVYPVIRPLAPKVMDKVASAIPKQDRLIEKVDQWRADH